jgi:hypothetical protein
MSKRSSPPPSTSTEPATKKPTLNTMTVPQVLPATSFLIQKLSAKAKTPTRGSALAAGYDLYSCVTYWLAIDGCSLTRCVTANNYSAVTKTIPARGKALVSTDLAIAVPEGTYGRVAPRSGLGESLLLSDALQKQPQLMRDASLQLPSS